MTQVPDTLAMIGFGEAGRTFASAANWSAKARVFDRYTEDLLNSSSKKAEYREVGVIGCETSAEAIDGAATIVSLVTANRALEAATEAAKSIARGAFYLDCNSVAPETKRFAAQAIETAGGIYVDVAILSPVQPAALFAPILVSGSEAAEAAKRLTDLGFKKVRVVGTEIGLASSIKMIRSVMVKGIEALTAECVLAASRADVLDEVISSLDASWPGADWRGRADYNLDRMLIHGTRRSAEMEEVVRTLDGLGVGSAMSRGTVIRQAEIGAMGCVVPPTGLTDKIASVLHGRSQDA